MVSLSAAILLGLVNVAMADSRIPDPTKCSATSASGSINITPAGHGPALGELGLMIQITIVDPAGYPLPGFPFQDIWLDDAGTYEISMCPNGCVADANTDENGRTTISRIPCGGGSTMSGLRAIVIGEPITGTRPLDINVNSPDLNGDLVVNVLDLANLAMDYADPAYNFRSDMTCDGLENIADIGEFAMHYGELCP